MIGAEAAGPVLVTSEDVGDQEPEMVSFTVPEGEMYGSSFDVTHGEEKDCPELRPLKMPQLGVPGLFFQSGGGGLHPGESCTSSSGRTLGAKGSTVYMSCFPTALSHIPEAETQALHLWLNPKPADLGTWQTLLQCI